MASRGTVRPEARFWLGRCVTTAGNYVATASSYVVGQTASRDGTCRIYSVEPESPTALARTRVTRGLTAEECRQHLHEVQYVG